MYCVPFQTSVIELYSWSGTQSALSLKTGLPLSKAKLDPLDMFTIENGTSSTIPVIVEIEPAEQAYNFTILSPTIVTIEGFVAMATVPAAMYVSSKSMFAL